MPLPLRHALALAILVLPPRVPGAVASSPEDGWPSVSVRLPDAAAEAASERSRVTLEREATLLPNFIFVVNMPEPVPPVPEPTGQVLDGNATAEPPPEWVDTGAVRPPGAPVNEGVFTRVLIPAVSVLIALSALAILFILIRRYRQEKHRSKAGARRRPEPPVRDIRPYRRRSKGAEPGAPRVYRVPKA